MGGRKLRYANKKNFERRRSEGRKSTEEESLVVSIHAFQYAPSVQGAYNTGLKVTN